MGDFKPLDLGTEGTVNMKIAAIDTDELADGSGNKAPITWISEELLKTSHRMNATNTTEGGWENTEMRTYLNETIKLMMPAEISAALKTVKKYTTNYNVSGTKVNNEVSSDDVWIPSAYEGGVNRYETTGAKYESIFTGAASRIKYKVGQSRGDYWWLRSAADASRFNAVSITGSYVNASPLNTYNVVIGFCT